MAPQELKGNTLGEKHKNYNNKLREAQHFTSLADNDDSDINNLLKIDIACRSKDVDYVLNVLQNEDMLCVSRVIARSTWLITDKEYENIINPDYLQSKLFPNMTTKAIIKFKKHIRLSLKEESRAEQFYLKETDKIEAFKWLPLCSVAFIESHVEDHLKSSQRTPLKVRLFKRLCERSITIFEVILKHLHNYERREYLQVVTFFLNTNVDKYLDVVENSNHGYPKLNHKATELIMKQSKNRVTEKMEKYISVIDIPTFVKYLNVDEIKTFLYAQAKKDVEMYEYRDLRRLFQYDTLKHFVGRLPKEEQFTFVKNVCIRSGNEETEKKMLNTDSDVIQFKKICNKFNQQRSYVWYQFAPFEQAFDEITKLISQNVESHEKRALFSTLIKCTKYNLERVQTVLAYYLNKHKNEDVSSKMQFVVEIINHTYVSKYDEKTWNLLNTILKSMNIYDASFDVYSTNINIINFIIIYNALNDQKTAEVIEKQFRFETFKSYRTKMSEAQQNKIFNYLYQYVNSKLNSPIVNEDDFRESIKTLENMSKLLMDWDKTLIDYPIVINKIQELLKLKKEHSWKHSLSRFYNINKSWRKHMFEESIDLSPNEEVCLNALKHEPLLLERHKEAIDSLRKEDNVSLQRLLAKLRIYWPNSLAQEWTTIYLNNINETNGQKAAVRGICTMLPQKPLFDFIDKYKPAQPKIDWKQTDDRVLSVQRLIAKNMHYARPQPTPDAILSYAKGDYLQYSLPALHSIFYNLKLPVAHLYIPKLLDSPVSLQKHGIRFAFKRFDHDELKKVFLNCWKSSKNASIRAIIFKYTHTLLCNEKDDAKAASLWELLDLFIDNLNFEEDKDIYKLFAQVGEVPKTIRANYIMKSYNFIQKLIPNLIESDRSHYQWIGTELARHSRTVMETMDSDFVKTVIQEFIENKFFNSKTSVYYSDDTIQVISAYLLCSQDENEQIQKYENVFVPIMRRSFEKWDEKANVTYFVRQHFNQLLSCLSNDLKNYVAENKKMIPLKMFSLIMAELEKSLSVTENYIILTKWKLTVALAKLTQEHRSENNKISPLEFGKICLELLKTDVSLHFPCIYVLFSICVKKVFDLLDEDTISEFFVSMISDKDFIQGYLSAIEIGSDHKWDEKYDQIWKQVMEHPSVEVKMHYYDKIAEKKI